MISKLTDALYTRSKDLIIDYNLTIVVHLTTGP